MKFSDIPDICKKHREELDYSPNYTAKLIGMNHESYLSFEEHHLQKIDLDKLDRLMKVLRIEKMTIDPNEGLEDPDTIVISDLTPHNKDVIREIIKRDEALRKAQKIHDHKK